METKTTDLTQTDTDQLLVPRFLSLVPEHAARLSPKLKPFAESALAMAERELRPASPEEFQRELSACIALIAPAGFTEAHKREWLIAAHGTLQGIPGDLLSRGAHAARRTCDHPSKVVPTILREAEEQWDRRKRNRHIIADAISKMGEPPLAKEERCTPEEAERIRKSLGIKYDDDAREKPANYIPVEKRTAPTRAEYLAWGVDPADIPGFAS